MAVEIGDRDCATNIRVRGVRLLKDPSGSGDRSSRLCH